MIYVVAGESFPTSVRSFVNAVSFGFSTLVAATASYVVHYAFEEDPFLVVVIMQAALFISSVCACHIKEETTGTQLKQLFSRVYSLLM